MTAPFTVASNRPPPAQRVKLLVTPSKTSWVWLCACGRNGWPALSQGEAFGDWEHQRAATCPLRPHEEV